MSEKYKMMFGAEGGFENKAHVRAYINYLCRTDESQTWTADNTGNDQIILCTPELSIDKLTDILDTRRSFARETDLIVQHLGAYVDANKLLALRKSTIEFDNKELTEFDGDMTRLFIELIEKMQKHENIIPVAAVSHEEKDDDLGCRIELLYFNYTEYSLIDVI
ncbi:hypothetical protein SAMN02910447_03321 [Ruminococcus sp. YE71]|uniref:hypothetical protein n=1 Tax=unclassified Ruminococcus TaxID=2608920 RepID=UPI00088BB201|nr:MULTISPECIES: hypothetical protein [unclassified Ruminococcus]SDA31050.1 hypothetical protein SAMN02910446_03390 [Ruminococcus sp. YE78]SFW50943.1 hypothetical protein SAMN02910447_03321 [Ruminococcus sp. YE71]